MKQFNARVEAALYEQATAKADELGISLAKLIRNAVLAFISIAEAEVKAQGNESDISIETLCKQVEAKDKQIEEKDKQIQELHQLLAMGHKERDRLAEQLERSNLKLEDLRYKRQWWRFWQRSPNPAG